jgi:phytoene dehydrogenase-like protein
MQKFDVIVIGGGIAGLSAAAHLARTGQAVVLLEQYDKPGGYYTSFVREGIIFDITAHWTVAHEQVNAMLAGLGASPLEFVHHPKIGQYFGPGASDPIRLVNDREQFEASILNTYPSAKKESIDRLVEISLKAEEEIRSVDPKSPELTALPEKALTIAQLPIRLRTVLKYSRVRSEDFLKSLFPGEDLGGLRAALYMLAPIKDFSAIGMLLYIAFALRGSAYMPKGGAFKAAEAFVGAATRAGVDIRYREKARSIRVEAGRVRGVTLENGENLEASAVVSAADIRQTFFEMLDPSLVPAAFRNRLESTPVSGTFVILSIVTDLNPDDYGFNHTDAFYTDTPDINAGLTPDDPEHSMISIQFPEFREEAVGRSLFGLQLVAPATFEYRDHWRTGPGYSAIDEYRTLKEDFAGRLVARAEKYMPGLSKHIIFMDIATPITMHRYTLNDLGAPVGWSYTSMQQWKQKVPFIEGLYLAGHWVGPSGIYNVAKSGANAAELILRKR